MNQYSTPPGWYPDGAGWERRWDGSAWTEDRRRTAPAQPPVQPPAQPPVQGSPPPAEPTQVRPPYGPPQGGAWTPPAGYGQVPAAPPAFPPPPNAAQNAPGQGAPYQGSPAQNWPAPGWPGQPAPGGPAERPAKRGRAGLWIALALVLVLIVGGGVAVAIVQPWSDDTTASGRDGGDSGGDGGGGDQPAGVSGDVDGDGRGDVTLALIDDIEGTVQLVEGASDGTAFEVATSAGDPASVPNTIAVDLDGDGAEELLSYSYQEDAGALGLFSRGGELPDTAPIELGFSSLAEYYPADAEVVAGDFDGDGNADLAAFGPADRTVDVYVLRGAGDGTFAAPDRWASIPNTLLSTTLLQSGDFDGDGDDDLFAELPAEQLKRKDYANGYFFGDEGIAALTSDGSGFDLSEVTEVDDYVSGYLVADLGGGQDRVLTLLSDSYEETLTVVAHEFLDGRLLADPGFRISDPIGDRDLLAVTASDVDGDGDEDLVYVVKPSGAKKVGDLTVLRTEDGSFTAGEPWGAVPACTYEYCSARFY